ncbi:MAG: bifunctional proline dehydrogenase/L-glutamate gamma-semialdehyde dehydrogenase [Propionibacteriaceae bacterium]|jgi:RHH-type proline utilization regulon transcriptional repressor/proline dehydrogenase/delta 1-pyrroline-5-carboxylate dehydrogenase|nr:bifunctional proline dehydrogenase/L-glutamate gamma-semialdehyde dehydrogenase [Propionibacteriaceae bacterium]
MNAAAESLIAQAIALTRRWVDEAQGFPVTGSAALLAELLKDPGGLPFAVGFVDEVVRPEDNRVAAASLALLAQSPPRSLPTYLKLGLKLGGWLAPVLPGLIVPIARWMLRGLVGHLIMDARAAKLTAKIAQVRDERTSLNLNLLGEAVLGQREADARLQGIIGLLGRDDVDYVSVKVSSVVAPHAIWSFSETVEQIAARLTPLFEVAHRGGEQGPKFINLDMEEYADLNLTVAVFTRILDQPAFANLEAGIVIQAYLPDALAAIQGLQQWAAARVAAGGTGIRVRLVKGANLPMEQMAADLHGWPLATWGTKVDTDTNFLRVLDWALQPEHTAAVKIGLASHNLFNIAYAWLLAGERGVQDALQFEMLVGMAQGQVEAVKATVGHIRAYVPVVTPKEFDVAIGYLVRRLEEGASSENFMSAVFELQANPALFAREQQRFEASLARLDNLVPTPHRTPDRYAALPAPTIGHFENTADTDGSLLVNQAQVAAIQQAARASELGLETVATHRLTTQQMADDLIEATAAAASGWANQGLETRAELLHQVGVELERRRSDLIEIMACEAGKTADQADPEISEAVDFAHYYAEQALELDQVVGARFQPRQLTVVVPPWNFPASIPAGGVLASLAAGSAVILKPATLTRRTGAVVAEAFWAAGVPKAVLAFVTADDRAISQRLITHPAVDQVILTGAYETAEIFRQVRPDLRLLAETSGKNAIIVTPSADINLAVKDVVYSAFGHAGQKCSACSLLILVGSMADSRRFRDQLVDAVSSLKLGEAWEPATMMGPLIEPPGVKLQRGLTTLEAGQSWVIRPEPVGDSGKLWSPGVREGVHPGSEFHLTEYFGPVLGIMVARSLKEAIEIANQVDYGLTSGLHSLDRAEITYWLDHIHAGNLYVNRSITGAIVQRQPFGGWKKSAVGAGAKAGGPNYLIGLGDWARDDQAARVESPAPPTEAMAALLAATKDHLSAAEANWLAQASQSDLTELASRFQPTDVCGLVAEHNLFRYLPLSPDPPIHRYYAPPDRRAGGVDNARQASSLPSTLSPCHHTCSVPLATRAIGGSGLSEPAIIRWDGADLSALLRVLHAAITSQSAFELTTAVPLIGALAEALQPWTSVAEQSDAEFAASLAGGPSRRVRLIGGQASTLSQAINGRVDIAIWDGAPTQSGRLELLGFLQEQAIAITAHRFGTPSPLVDNLV